MILRRIALIFFLIPAIAGSLVLHYVLPRYAIIQITGLETKRAENPAARMPEGAADARDQYLIFAKNESESDLVFRNEDTGWGLPPYFKFDAAEIQAEAGSLQHAPALIKFYGRRLKLFRLFPNILSVQAVPADPSLTSYTRLGIFSVWGLFLVWLFPRWYGLFLRRGARP